MGQTYSAHAPAAFSSDSGRRAGPATAWLRPCADVAEPVAVLVVALAVVVAMLVW
jgi:hypothetical protein